MKTPSLLLDYSRYPDARLDLKAQTISNALEGNSYFPETRPSLQEFNHCRTVFSESLNGAASGDRVAISAKNKAREDLLQMMRSLVYNIQSQAGNNRTRLISSGFELAADGSSSQMVSAPADFRLEEGANKGEIKFSSRRCAGARCYLYEYTLEPPSPGSIWITRVSTLRFYLFSGLPSGTLIYGRMAALGARNQLVYSDVLSRIVQ